MTRSMSACAAGMRRRVLIALPIAALALSVALARQAASGAAEEGDSSKAKAEASDAKADAKKADAKKPAKKPAGPKVDWLNWRGPLQRSVSLESGLVDEWSPKGGDGSNLVWKRSELGTRSTPVVMDGKLYVLCRDKPGSANEGEKVVCVDAATGENIWQYRFNVSLTDVPDTRVAWSNVVADPETKRVYALGVCGYFCCLDAETGKVVWDRALHEEFGFVTTYGGRTTTPVIFDDLVLVPDVLVNWGGSPKESPPGFDGLALPAYRYLGLDKATGEIRWLSSTNISPPDTTYSTPYVGVVGGEAQLIFGAADGSVWSMQPRTGKILWNVQITRRGINASVLVDGTTVYASHSEENLVGLSQGGVVAIDATQRGNLAGKEKWVTYNTLIGKSSMVMVNGKLWGIDDRGKLTIFDPANGNVLQKKALDVSQRSTPIVADGKVYVCTGSGIWYVLEPSEDGSQVKVVTKMRLRDDENDGSPIVSGGRIYLPTSAAIYCIGPDEVEGEAPTLPTPVSEPSLGDDTQPDTVQVVPYDATLKPGESQPYQVRLYNKRGQFLSVAKPDQVTFRVEGTGEVAGDGVFTAPKRRVHTASLVFAKVGELEGKARIRIVPPLPWTFDFNKDPEASADKATPAPGNAAPTAAPPAVPQVPITWVGGRVRYEIVDIDGEKAAMKKNVLPTPRDPKNKLGTNSKMFMGPHDLTNYTIQADVRLAEENKRLPDIGLINSGYTMTLRSQNDLLRVYSWSSHDHRTSTEVALTPEVGVWYRMKLRVEQKKNTALVQGKMWLREQPEPEDWTIEMTDSSPVRSGSPGVYGKTEDAVVYVDNISVMENKQPQTEETARN